MPRTEVVTGASYYRRTKAIGITRKVHKPTGYTYAYDKDAPPIQGFFGEFHFLSNFYPSPFLFFGEEMKTAEHAYQAFKSHDYAYRMMVLNADTPKKAKRHGSRIKLRDDWEQFKFKHMLTVVGRKFADNPELLRKLLATGYCYLEETNTWDDTCWGVCNGEGANHLGKILMCIRFQYMGSQWRGKKWLRKK